MSETTPLNEWPVEKLYTLQYIINSSFDPIIEIKDFKADKEIIINIIRSAIKDAEEKLNELPFK